MFGLHLRALPALATLFVGLILLPTSSLAKPKTAKPMPAHSSRIDESLTAGNIPAEITLAPSEAQLLLHQARQTQLFSAAAGHTSGAANLIEMAPLYAGSGRLSRRAMQKRQTGPADLTIRLDDTQAMVTLGTGEGAISWPLEQERPIMAVHALTHTQLTGDAEKLQPYIAQSTKAATHPVALVISDDELLLAYNMMMLISRNAYQDALGDRRTNREYGYRTGLLPIDLNRITSESLDDFVVVLSVETFGRGPFQRSAPFVWLLPIKDGAFDSQRYGYKMSMSLEVTGSSGIPGLFRQQSWNPVGFVTRVKLAGSAPVLPSPPPTAQRGDASNPSPPMRPTAVPGTIEDPLLNRRRAPSEPMTWGVSGTGGGGAGIEPISNTGIQPVHKGALTGWFGPGQVMFALNPRYFLGSALYRFGAARDTNYFGVGLTMGSFAKDFAVGPRFHMSRYQRFYGMKMVHEFTLDLLVGKQAAGNLNQSLAFRISTGKGFFILPGGFVNFNIGIPSRSKAAFVDSQIGLQVTVLLNQNLKK